MPRRICYWTYTLVPKTSSLLRLRHCITQILGPYFRMISLFIYCQNSLDPQKYLYSKFIFLIHFSQAFSFLLLGLVCDYLLLKWINLNYYWNEVNAPLQSLMPWVIRIAMQQSSNLSQPYFLFTFMDYYSKEVAIVHAAKKHYCPNLKSPFDLHTFSKLQI